MEILLAWVIHKILDQILKRRRAIWKHVRAHKSEVIFSLGMSCVLALGLFIASISTVVYARHVVDSWKDFRILPGDYSSTSFYVNASEVEKVKLDSTQGHITSEQIDVHICDPDGSKIFQIDRPPPWSFRPTKSGLYVFIVDNGNGFFVLDNFTISIERYEITHPHWVIGQALEALSVLISTFGIFFFIKRKNQRRKRSKPHVDSK